MEAPPAHRNTPSEYSGVPAGFFSKRPCYGLFFKTLDLQVRFAPPPSAHRTSSSSCSGVPHGLFGSDSAPRCLLRNAHASVSLRSPFDAAPNQLFKLLRCSAWLIRLRQRTALSPPKRSCSRFASLTLRVHREGFGHRLFGSPCSSRGAGTAVPEGLGSPVPVG